MFSCLIHNQWCVDSGGTVHVCIFIAGFQATRQLSEGEIWLYLDDSTKVATVAIRTFTLYFSIGRILVLKNCPHVPFIRRNLISVSKLVKDNVSICWN